MFDLYVHNVLICIVHNIVFSVLSDNKKMLFQNCWDSFKYTHNDSLRTARAEVVQ